MSRADPDQDVDVPSGYENVDEWATAAVRGANNWLVTLRNATDEGIDPWSDEFTSGRNGIMTYAEALTALALTEQFAPVDRPDWNTLRRRYYQEDLKYILDRINAEEGPKLKPEPYLRSDDDDESVSSGLDTNHFTVAATFSTSAILESLQAEVDFGDEIDEDEIKDALDTNLEWLLSNAIEGESLQTPDAVGWAWLGSESDRFDEMNPRPANYFTYSVTIVLCDLLTYRNIDVVDEVVTEHEADLVSALKGANEFLLEEYWEGDYWSIPTGIAGEVRNKEKLLSTCYAFIGLSYIAASLDDVDVASEQGERMATAMNWALNYYEEQPNLWALTVDYDCGPEETFTDGSAPYVMLDSLLELINYRPELIDDVDDFDRSAIEGKIREKLAPVVLDKCWAGDRRFEQKGFRHIGEGDRLLRDPDGAPEYNMTAIYSTGVAIETFLLNFLEEGENFDFGTETDTESASVAGSTEAIEEPDSAPHQVERKTVNNIILNENGEEGDVPEAVGEQLRDIQSEVRALSAELGDGSDDGAVRELETRSLAFLSDLNDCESTLDEEYDEHWVDVTDDLGSAKQPIASSLQENWEEKFKRINTGQFTEYLREVYFCPDRETYDERVAFGERTTLLLPPQRAIVDEISGWNDERFTDTDGRRGYVEERVGELTEEPWGGEDISDAVYQFKKRFEEETS
jgi:hypothetical protein